MNGLLGLRRRPLKLKEERWCGWSVTVVWVGRWNSFTLSLHEEEAFGPPSSSGVTRSGCLLPCTPPLSAMLLVFWNIEVLFLFWFDEKVCVCVELPFLVIRRRGDTEGGKLYSTRHPYDSETVVHTWQHIRLCCFLDYRLDRVFVMRITRTWKRILYFSAIGNHDAYTFGRLGWLKSDGLYFYVLK